MRNEYNFIAGKHACIKLAPNFINIIDIFSSPNDPKGRLINFTKLYDIDMETAHFIDIFYTLLWINSAEAETVTLDNALSHYQKDREIILRHAIQLENLLTRDHTLIEIKDVIEYWETTMSNEKIKELC